MIKQIEILYKLIFFILTFFIILSVKSQDSIIYAQEKSIFFTNKYILYPKLKKFKHKYATDDGQIWYGQGMYSIKKKKIIFSFKDIDNFTTIYFHSNSCKTNKLLTIKFLDLKGNLIINSISYNDKIYFPDYDGNIIFNKSIFKTNEPNIIIIQNNHTHKIKLKNLVYLDSIKIVLNEPTEKIHYEENFERTLRFYKKHLVSKDFYNTSKNKKVKFRIEFSPPLHE